MKNIVTSVAQFPKRMWINQPSTLQPHHALHGTNVLAVHEYDDTFCIFFLSGEVVSQQVFRSVLSPGWRPAPKVAQPVAPEVAAELPTLEVDDSQFTRTRVKVTSRLPNGARPGDPPWVMLEAEDNSVAIAAMGTDSPAARADAARMMRLWNDALGQNAAA